eukprot:m51a1_g4229 hypothetical protein (960) ;mRNA; r:115926-120193
MDCTAKFTGFLEITLFVWDASSSAVYDPIDFQIEWSCAVPGCNAQCESLGHGTCEYLLGECRCRDGYSGTYCGYKLDMNRTQSPGVPFTVGFTVLKPTGAEWLAITDSAGVEYDYRYLFTWNYDENPDAQEGLARLVVNRTMETFLPPGAYVLSLYRDDFNRLMGQERFTVRQWHSASCSSNLDCNNGTCAGGTCVCGGAQFGGHCERGCSNATVLREHAGVVQSDAAEPLEGLAMYAANTRCMWAISPNGSRGGDWDYIHLEFDWANIGPGDKLQVWYGSSFETAKLDQTFTGEAEFTEFHSDSVFLVFISDSESGSAGFKLHYDVRRNSKNIVPLAVGICGGAVCLAVFVAIVFTTGHYCRHKGRKDPKKVNIPVEADGSVLKGVCIDNTVDMMMMSPTMTATNQASSSGFVSTGASNCCFSVTPEGMVYAAVVGAYSNASPVVGPTAAPAHSSPLASSGSSAFVQVEIVSSGTASHPGAEWEYALTPLTRNITLGWSSTSPSVQYSMRNAFTLTNSSAAVVLPVGGPVSVRSLAESGTVPTAPTLWLASISCTAKFTGILRFTFFVWDANSSAVYDPIDFQIEWSCAVPGCNAQCESLGHGTCEYLLGECRCRDGYSGTYCGYKLDMNRTQRPGVPFAITMTLMHPLGSEWFHIVDTPLGAEYDYRYFTTWSHDYDLSFPRGQAQLVSNHTFRTYLPPGTYILTTYRDYFANSMGDETFTVLPWDNTSCSSLIDCNGDPCASGECACSKSRFGGHCERGCANRTVLNAHSGVVQSDAAESSEARAMYNANTQCVWVIAPNGSRGQDWDYIQLEVDWASFGEGDSLQVWTGSAEQSVKLSQTLTSKVDIKAIHTNVIYILFASDIESGSAGFMLHYSTHKNSKNIIPIAVGIPGGVAVLCVFAGVACVIGFFWKGRRDPKIVNLPVELDGTVGAGVFADSPIGRGHGLCVQHRIPSC